MMKKIIAVLMALAISASGLCLCAFGMNYDGLVDSGIEYKDSTVYLDNPMNGVPDCEFVTLKPNGDFSFSTDGRFHQFFFDMRLFSGGYTMVKTNSDGDIVYDENGNFIFDLNGKQIPLTKEMKAARVTDEYVAYDWALNNPNRGGEKDIPLTDEALDAMRACFEKLRENGGTCIVSPSYASQGELFNEPLDFNVLLTHVKQLAQVFTEYSDVIGAIEIRTIGPFGEMWGSPYCSAVYANQIIDGYLENTPDNIKVMVRTPGYAANYLIAQGGEGSTKSVGIFYDKNGNKIKVMSGGGPWSFANANYEELIGLDLDKFKRISMFNDGYMLTSSDTGTWSDRQTELKWLSWATQYSYYGGEYGGGTRDDTFWLPDNALPEMFRTHVSYMHDNYYRTDCWNCNKWTIIKSSLAEAEKYVSDLIAESGSVSDADPGKRVLDPSTVEFVALTDDPAGSTKIVFNNSGYDHFILTEELAKACTKADVSEFYGYTTYTFMRNLTGYRFVLRDSDLTGEVKKGGLLQIAFDIENNGMANCIQEKVSQLVLVKDGAEIAVLDLNGTVDANDWLSQERYELGVEVRLANNIDAGEYDAYLRVCNVTNDGKPNIKTCVQFANSGIYHPNLRANYLGSFTVTDEESGYGNESFAQVTTVFEDVQAGSWYENAVKDICTRGIMNGVSAVSFDPMSTTTRGQFVTVLYNMEGKPDVSQVNTPFTDVAEGGYFTAPVAWAYENDIVKGTGDTTFDPNGKLTREQFATMLYRYASYKGVNVSDRADLDAYEDGDSVSNYAKETMSWANAKGYITGMTATTLKPKEYANRAQMATILTRYLNN